jgi:CDGSH-type Zn-finger protein
MDLPKIAEKFPKQVELEAGKKYAWCSCGLSDNQPFCDGKHKGTGFAPIVFECEQSKTAHFCQCKKTQTGPYCDGTHHQLDQPT